MDRAVLVSSIRSSAPFAIGSEFNLSYRNRLLEMNRLKFVTANREPGFNRTMGA
jgi:hypothetical protein